MSTRTAIARAAREILAGGVVAYPTEAVFGLGCLPDNEAALERIIGIKRRSWRKGMLIVAADTGQIERFAVLPAGAMREAIDASWPGPSTWIVDARDGVSKLVTGGTGRIAVRVTDHPVARALCLAAGSAIISTSANRTRRPPLRRLIGVRRELGRAVDYVLAGPLGGQAKPTTIRDARTGEVLRPG